MFQTEFRNLKLSKSLEGYDDNKENFIQYINIHARVFLFDHLAIVFPIYCTYQAFKIIKFF